MEDKDHIIFTQKCVSICNRIHIARNITLNLTEERIKGFLREIDEIMAMNNDERITDE